MPQISLSHGLLFRYDIKNHSQVSRAYMYLFPPFEKHLEK